MHFRARTLRKIVGPLLAVPCLLWLPSSAGAQEEPPPDSIRAELDRLRARIDSLEAVLRSLQERGAAPVEQEEPRDALAELRAAAEAAAREGGAAQADTAAGPGQRFAGRQRSLQALNPEISVNVDLFGHLNPDDANEQNFVPREFEFSFQSTLDPFSRAKVYISRHGEGPETIPFEEGGHGHAGEDEGEGEGGHDEESGFEIEEGYVEWVGLPGGVSLKLGKFFQRFGTLNRWHAHALPFQSRSLPHLAFIGEGSLAQTGASLSTLLPFGGDAGTYEATFELTRSSNGALFGESSRPSLLGNLNAFWQLSDATDLDLGLSWINGSYEDEEHLLDRNLLGAEVAFNWLPPARSKYRGLEVRGGVMILDGLVPHEEEGEAEGEEETDRALGFWSSAEVRLGRQWLAGGRFDWTENPADPERTAWMVSPTLTWWQSEWVRLRLEYDHLARSWLDDGEGRLWLQVTFAMGPHKHETY